MLWPADFNGGEYGEAGAFYHNRDSTTSISVYVKAYPSTFQGRLPWLIIADEQEARQMLLAKNHGLAIIEDFKADSLTRTTVISYRLANQQERGWRGQLNYNKSITIYGRHRIISFWLSGPDSPVTRQQFTAIQASIQVTPAYLQDTSHPPVKGVPRLAKPAENPYLCAPVKVAGRCPWGRYQLKLRSGFGFRPWCSVA